MDGWLLVNGAAAAGALGLGCVPLWLTARLKRRLPALRAAGDAAPWCPPASLVLPCKGIDPGFDDNLLALLGQDYPGLEKLFVVATADDPAYGAIAGMLARRPDLAGSARLIVAGVAPGRAQKLTNQLAALREASPRSEVLVFVDSDCRPDPGFVRRLVAPLAADEVGATTGYRWYHPPRADLGSMLRSTWNAGALPFLVDDRTTHAWGGAMAIRRQVFERAGIERAWDNAVSDDMTLTVAVHRLGLRLQFVPQCIAVSHEASTLAQTLEFTNRQSLISRIYLPPLWWGTALGHGVVNLLAGYGLYGALAWAVGGAPAMLAAAACLLIVPMQMANAAWMFGSVRGMLPPALRRPADALRWRYMLCAPLASVMCLVNTVHAASTRRLTWRGITYELRSPVETVVVGR